MPSFRDYLTEGWRRSGTVTSLAAVPFVLSLTNFDAIAAVVSHEGFHIGFTLGLPVSVVTVWQFVDPPSTGVSVTSGLPASAPLAIVTIPAVALVHTVLGAGYFGRLADHVTGRDRSFADCVRAYVRPFLVLVLLPYLFFVPLAGGALGLGAVGGSPVVLFVLAVPILVAAAYLFYAAPYLVVLRDIDAVSALRTSYRLAIQGGPYLQYAVAFAVSVLLVSPVLSLVVVNIPGVGLLVGIAVGSYLGLVANLTTMLFVADLNPATTAAHDLESGGGLAPSETDGQG